MRPNKAKQSQPTAAGTVKRYAFAGYWGVRVLTSDMHMLKFVIAFLVLAAPFYSNAQTPPTHCTGDEKIYFNCLIKDSKKVASVCGAGFSETVLSGMAKYNESGYLQYRFGVIGTQEFKYPSTINKDDMKDRFNFSASRSKEYDYYDSVLQFNNPGYAYIVYSGEEHKPDDQINYSSSITIWKLVEPCLGSQCPPRAPYATPEGKIVKVLACSNDDAGGVKFDNLSGVVRLMSSPGRNIGVTLPYTFHSN